MGAAAIYIPGYEGRAVRAARGETFRVVDVEGCQIADMFILAADDPQEYFSPAMTRQVTPRLVPKPGDVLYSNRRKPLATFLRDTSPGRHDMSFAACDPGFYVDLGGNSDHPNCRDNYSHALEAIGVDGGTPPDPFNLFQNTIPGADGEYEVAASVSRAGDFVEFRAEADLVVVVTACSVDLPIDGVHPIGGESTPLRLEVSNE